MHHEIIDNLITKSNRLFKQYIFAHAVINYGQHTLSGFPDSVCIGTTVGLNIDIEPIPMGELKRGRESLLHILLEIFHGKLVLLWHDSLYKLMEMLVDFHFSGRRRLIELKKWNISLDFRELTSLEEQVKERLCSDFDFQKYSDKVRILNEIFNPKNEGHEHLTNIAKNVQIRNSFQHRRGKVDEFLLKELGVQEIGLIGSDGKIRNFKLGDSIKLSIPEFDSFRRSLLMIGQVWRKWNG